MKRWTFRLLAAALIIAAFFAGRLFAPPPAVHEAEHEHQGTEVVEDQAWTCSMHPQIRQPKPGKCPLCGMDLIPVESGGGEEDGNGAPTLTLSPSARKLASIQVATVERKFVTVAVDMVGKVDFDETRLGHISAWVPGRIDRLYVDYTGISVKKGDHMVYLYSPELLTAQEELIQALKAVDELRESGLASIRETARRTVEAVRVKLRLLGLTDGQIDEIEERGRPSDHMTIYAPMGGIVIERQAAEGMYVDTGSRIYTIADLSRVWVKLDVYESDLSWIRYGQEVEFSTEAYPGELFHGRIAFIDPVLDAATRTVKVRVNVDNDDGRLKPEMFVRATVRARVSGDGRVMEADLAGKWICPMHPDVVNDTPDSCGECGMPLVRAESLGYVSEERISKEAPLVVPASAPLITGQRAVVYVQTPEREGSYEGREIVLGPRAGNHYLVKDGLSEGEVVVVNGNFKIDSAIQIMAKPSMMNPDKPGPAADGDHQHGDMEPPGPDRSAGTAKYDVPPAFSKQLSGVLDAYGKLHFTLSRDNFDAAVMAAGMFLEALEAVDMAVLEGPAHHAWMDELKNLRESAGSIQAADTIEAARRGFALLSESMIAVQKTIGPTGDGPVILFHCPMVFDGRGADWLQRREGTENPYYGAMMFKCGEQVEVITKGR